MRNHSHFTVVFDACVLYPATLRNLLIQLASTRRFRATWTTTIREEWTRALRTDKPDISPTEIERIAELMEAAVPDCMVTGYEPLIETLTLPDPADRHVLAAAIRTHADLIVTTNIKDFPSRTLAPLGVHAVHPDDFILHLHDLDAAPVLDAARCVRSRLRNPPFSAGQFLDLLKRQGLEKTAAVLRSSLEHL